MATKEGPALPGEPGKKGSGGGGRPVLPGEPTVAVNKTDSDTARRTREKTA